MKYRMLSLFFAFFLLVGCNKPEPNPEMRDPIYQDYLVELDLAKKAVEAEEKLLAEHETAYKAVVPQSGQIKYARKRIEESQEKINRFKQQVQYFEIKSKDRLKETRRSYLRAFNAGETWPNHQEIEDYQGVLKLRRAKIAADKNQRMKPPEEPKKPAAGEGGGH